MSVELEWELYDIFDSGTFAFPIYDHNSARRIVRYLLMRGILHEEIAEAIEDSTADLVMWLNRHGKHKIGEWVIAWINDCREEFDRGDLHREDDGSEFDRDFFLREDTPDSDPGRRGSDGDDDDRPQDRRSDSRITDLDSISSQAGTNSTADAAHLDIGNACGPPTDHMRTTTNPYLPPPPPPPRGNTPPHTPYPPNTPSRKRPRPTDLDLSKTDLAGSNEGLYEPPDSGHFSDLYTAIPSDNLLESITNNNNAAASCADKLLGALGPVPCEFHSAGTSESSPLKCTCSVAHYSYMPNHGNDKVDDVEILDLPQDKLLFTDSPTYCDIYFSESVTRAMEYNFDTLDREGPGFIFIMTDSIANCLPWSSVHRYKIASSRQPDRCLLEFRSRNVEIDLIWQVKVKNHVKALREIQNLLRSYNLHSNWYKCSLSLIMDTVCRVAKQYK